LERLSPDLFTSFAGDSRFAGEAGKSGRSVLPRGEKLKKARDFTHSIKIGDEVFEIGTVKGKKEVKLPWEQLARVRENLPKENYFKGLKGTIIVQGEYTLLAGEKLDLILSLAPSLDIEGALERRWPRKNTFNSREDLPALLEELPKLVSPAPWKHNPPEAESYNKLPYARGPEGRKQKGGGEKRRGKDSGPGKTLGFICLFTDGAGNYWFKCSRGFHTSLNESLSSLETLIDELGDDVDIEKKHVVNQVYRRLSDYLG
jgi:hypothetical protein